MKTVRVHRHQARRRVGEIDGVEVHVPPLDPEVIGGIPPAPVELYPRQGFLPYGDADYDWTPFERHGGFFLLREGDGSVAGILQGEYSDSGPRQTAYLHGVEVYRGRRTGIGRRLVTAFETWARQRGARRVRINALTAAESFWTKMGYQRVYEGGGVWEKEL